MPGDGHGRLMDHSVSRMGWHDLVLARIAALNQDLLVSARQGDWQQVQALEKARRVLVQDFIENKLNPTDPCLVRCIQEIIQVDREIVRLSLVKRRPATTELRPFAG